MPLDESQRGGKRLPVVYRLAGSRTVNGLRSAWLRSCVVELMQLCSYDFGQEVLVKAICLQTALAVFQDVVHRASLVVLGDIMLSVDIYTLLFRIIIPQAEFPKNIIQ